MQKSSKPQTNPNSEKIKISIQKERLTGKWGHLERSTWTVRVNNLEVGHIYARDRSSDTTYYWAIASSEELGLPHINKAQKHLTLEECKSQAKAYIKEHCQKTNAQLKGKTNSSEEAVLAALRILERVDEETSLNMMFVAVETAKEELRNAIRSTLNNSGQDSQTQA